MDVEVIDLTLDDEDPKNDTNEIIDLTLDDVAHQNIYIERDRERDRVRDWLVRREEEAKAEEARQIIEEDRIRREAEARREVIRQVKVKAKERFQTIHKHGIKRKIINKAIHKDKARREATAKRKEIARRKAERKELSSYEKLPSPIRLKQSDFLHESAVYGFLKLKRHTNKAAAEHTILEAETPEQIESLVERELVEKGLLERVDIDPRMYE